MNKYEIIIYWSSADGAYIAEVPELPGCMADGKTYAETLHNAELIISEWLETARDLGTVNKLRKVTIVIPRLDRGISTKMALLRSRLPGQARQ
jgi:predicted RNase H-like HicB family nuclease